MDRELESALLARIQRIPIVATLDLQIMRFGDGFCEARVPRRLDYDGVYASFHGGLLMTTADSTACFAVLTRTGPDTRLTTTDMNIRLKPLGPKRPPSRRARGHKGLGLHL